MGLRNRVRSQSEYVECGTRLTDGSLIDLRSETILAIGVLERNLAASKRKQIAAMNFYSRAVRTRSGKGPFRDASRPTDEMTWIAPMRIGKGRPDFGETDSHGLAADIAGAGDVGTCRGFENAIFSHEGHESVDIVAVPRIGEVLQDLDGDLLTHIGMQPPMGQGIFIGWRITVRHLVGSARRMSLKYTS